MKLNIKSFNSRKIINEILILKIDKDKYYLACYIQNLWIYTHMNL